MFVLADLSSSFASRRTAGDDHDRVAAARREAAVADAALVRRFNGGDDAAFLEIMNRHRTRMFSIAFALLKNRADAEEIVQDTFLRAHRSLARFRGDASLGSWLHRIALNLSHSRYWYYFRRRCQVTFSLDRALGDDQHGTVSDLVATDDAGPARAAVMHEFAVLVADCIARLGPRQRQVLTLRNSLDHSYREIALELGITLYAVKSRMARARESLRVLLVEACPEFGPEARPAAWLEIGRLTGERGLICA